MYWSATNDNLETFQRQLVADYILDNWCNRTIHHDAFHVAVFITDLKNKKNVNKQTKNNTFKTHSNVLSMQHHKYSECVWSWGADIKLQ